MIDFEEGAVCYADEQFWFGERRNGWDYLLDAYDFELNEPREGYYIPKSELDTEEKYNQAVEVFGLFGYEAYLNNRIGLSDFITCAYNEGLGLILDREGDIVIDYDDIKDVESRKVKLTFDQLMAIGELKRKMNERESKLYDIHIDTSSIERAEANIGKTKRRNKSKQAYDILKDLDYEYDLVKQQWYKKEWV